MKTAFAYLDKRIAPVFDTARQLHIITAESDRIVSETQELLANDQPLPITLRLAELGVGTLVCGAISRPLQAMVAAYGIQVIPFVAGDLRKVIQAWLSGNLAGDTFAMPGCCGRARSRYGVIYINKKERKNMNGKGRGKMGSGDGRGPGGGMGGGSGRGQGRGRMGGSLAGGAVGTCLCPKCGHRMAHERSVPCVQRQCPKCGTAITRE